MPSTSVAALSTCLKKANESKIRITSKLWEARSRPYLRRFLQINTHSKALGEIYTSYQYMCPYILLHRSGLQFSYQSRPIFSKWKFIFQYRSGIPKLFPNLLTIFTLNSMKFVSDIRGDELVSEVGTSPGKWEISTFIKCKWKHPKDGTFLAVREDNAQ